MFRLAVAAAVFVSSLTAHADPRDPRVGKLNIGEGEELGEFTFVRIRYSSRNDGPRPQFYGRWSIDWPESDMHFSQRLSELTTIKVARNKRGDFKPVVLDLTDERIFNYPFVYMLEVGDIILSDAEVENLREYLLRGGFLMVDDFWGEQEWFNWELELRRVFPKDEYPIVELPLSHPIFHIVFDLKEKPQVPAEYHWRMTRTTSERQDSQEPHYRGIFDKNGRLMMVMCHNTDLGDGWEREGENHEYFNLFSAKQAYPLGINIVVYALTH